MYLIVILLAACWIFRRRLAKLLPRCAALARRVQQMREPIADFIRGEYRAPRKPEPAVQEGCTRPQPAHMTRPAMTCHPLLKYVPVEAMQQAPTCVPVSKLPFRIGRSPGCDLTIDDQTLSQTHFEIIARGESYGVRNLSETNGLVLVNEQTQRIGVRIQEAGRIQMIDPACGYLRFWAGGQFFQLTLADFRAPAIM